jgi:beta-1,4-mannosyltransferase
VIKGLALLVALIRVLSDASPYDLLVVQNPPCLPVLLAAAFMNITLLAQPHNKIILDWHNLGYSMFSSYKPSPTSSADETVNELPIEPTGQSLLVQFARFAEIFLTQMIANYQICVSKSMKKYLELQCHARDVLVLYDRPMRRQPLAAALVDSTITIAEKATNNLTPSQIVQKRHELFAKYGLTDKELGYPAFEALVNSSDSRESKSAPAACGRSVQATTLHTKSLAVSHADELLVYEMREDKPFTIITATSWTPDEDFELLLSAAMLIEHHLQTYNQSMTSSKYYHKLTILITGKGPLRADFEQRIQKLESSYQLIYVKIRCLWLSSEDYFNLLSYCDIGLCLHNSTCGLDLPMKVLDMLGAGLVVLASRYYAISELIRHEENGLLFHGAQDLVENILRLMMNSSNNQLVNLRQHHHHERLSSWHENWNEVMKPLVEDLIARPGIRGVGYYYIYLLSILAMLALLMAYLSYHIAHAKVYDTSSTSSG